MEIEIHIDSDIEKRVDKSDLLIQKMWFSITISREAKLGTNTFIFNDEP